MTAGSNAVALVEPQDEGIRQLPVVPTAQKLALALPSLDELKVLEAYGKMFADSGLFPAVRTWQAAAAIIQYGSQLGIDAFTALKDIYWISGKPSCDASLINSLIKRDHGGDALMPVEATKERCTIRFKRREWEHYEEATVTADDYKYLVDDKTKTPWQNNRADMLWARNVSQIGRRHFSDTIKGLYTREEMVDAMATEASYRVVPSAPEPRQTAAAAPPPVATDDAEVGQQRTVGEPTEPPAPEAPDPKVIKTWLGNIAKAPTVERLDQIAENLANLGLIEVPLLADALGTRLTELGQSA